MGIKKNKEEDIIDKMIKIQTHIAEAFHLMGKLIHDIMEAEKKEKKDDDT